MPTKSLFQSALWVVAAGLVGGVAVASVGLEPGTATSAYAGVGVSTLMGCVALVLKSQVQALFAQGRGELQGLLLVQGASFGLRLMAVGVGAFACRRDGLSSAAFVVGFFGVYLVQQLIEVRYLLAAQRAVSVEVKP
jgi:hypothetical protein